MLGGPGVPLTSNGGMHQNRQTVAGRQRRGRGLRHARRCRRDAWRRHAPLRQRDDGGDHDQRHGGHRQQADRPEPVERRRLCRHAGQSGSPAERRDIAAARQVDADGVVGTEAGVIAVDSPPQPRRLDPHDRIELRIEFGVAAQHVDADRIGLDAVALALQHRLDDEAQKRATAASE